MRVSVCSAGGLVHSELVARGHVATLQFHSVELADVESGPLSIIIGLLLPCFAASISLCPLHVTL